MNRDDESNKNALKNDPHIAVVRNVSVGGHVGDMFIMPSEELSKAMKELTDKMNEQIYKAMGLPADLFDYKYSTSLFTEETINKITMPEGWFDSPGDHTPMTVEEIREYWDDCLKQRPYETWAGWVDMLDLDDPIERLYYQIQVWSLPIRFVSGILYIVIGWLRKDRG